MSLNISGNILTSSNANSNGEIKSILYLPDDGLVCNMNANNFDGSSQTWIDSVQGIVFNNFNTGAPYSTNPTPKTNVSNVPAIQFNSVSYWQTSLSDSYKIDLRGAYTLVLIYWFPSNVTRHNLFEKVGTTYSSYQQELATTWETNNTLSWYRSGGQDSTYDYASTKAYTQSQWNFIATKGGADANSGYYYDSSSGWVSAYTNRSSTNILQSGVARIGNGYTGIMEVGYLHACLIWNVDLNATRIQQVYNYYSNQFTQLGTTLYS
jgi:hypothetical protein